MKYRTIVADPPWQVTGGPRWNDDERTRPLPYPTMTLREIRALPVRRLADDDAHLYLWTINRYLRDAFYVVQVWGFNPSTVLTWCKPVNGYGLGGAFGQTTEFVLYARRGQPETTGHVSTTWFEWPRGEHSTKPEAFLDLVESVGSGPYLELFARRQRLGWDTWGDEALNHLEVIL